MAKWPIFLILAICVVNSTTRKSFDECPCLPEDKSASFEHRFGRYYVIYLMGHPLDRCYRIYYRMLESGVQKRVSLFYRNDIRNLVNGKNFKIKGDRFFAYNLDRKTLEYSTTFYHDYDPVLGCVAFICCYLTEPNNFNMYVLCRQPNPDQKKVDKILDIYNKTYARLIKQDPKYPLTKVDNKDCPQEDLFF